jgi:hypothetical protein
MTQNIEAADTVDEVDESPLLHENVIPSCKPCSWFWLRDIMTGLPGTCGIVHVEDGGRI